MDPELTIDNTKPLPAWMPEEGGFIIIDLPNEKIRAKVHRVLDEDSVLVVLSVQTPVQKTHLYKFNDLVAAVRKSGVLGEIWEVVPEAQIEAVRQEKRRLQAEAFAAAQRAAKSDAVPRSQSLKRKA